MVLSEFFVQLFEICILPLFLSIVVCIIGQAKSNISYDKAMKGDLLQKKYLNLLNETIQDCVLATNQTFVETLKKNGAFNKESAQEAFEMTYKAVLEVLSEDALTYLRENTSDLKMLLIEKIEAEVNRNKKN